MKRAFSAFTAFILLAVSLIYCSSSEGYSFPEIMTVETNEKSEYGFIDYKFVDGEGNETDIFNFSYLPDKRSLSQKNSVSFFSSYSPMSALPSSFDARDYGCITSAKQQGISGNCWAFSVMSMLESDAILKGFDDSENADYSEAHFSWFTSRSLTDNPDDPTYGDGYLSETPYATGGNWIISAGSLARWTGAAQDSDYPFNYRDLSQMGNYDESCRYDTGSGVIIDSAQSLLGMDDAKSWIMEHGSATFSFYFAEDYYNSNTFSYYYNGTESLNHEITVIGWNDNYSRFNFNSSTQPAGNGAWLCKNSWGHDWGDDGFFWVSYYDSSISQFAGFSARSVEEVYRNYTYNGTGWESYVNHVGNAKISNVFTSKGSELLTSVSTYTMMPAQEVNVYIYKNLPAGFLNPEQGSLAHKKNVILDRPGYHIIDLDAEISLASGTVFSVVIEYVTDGTVYFPVEADGQGTNSYYANKGESFLNLPSYNKGWYDVLSYRLKNVFVQAFTRCNHQSFTEIIYATCENDGAEIISCSACGKLLRETVIPAAGHDFTDWSNYVHDFSTDREVRTRLCRDCGITESESIFYSKNTIKLEDFIQKIFNLIFEILRNIF